MENVAQLQAPYKTTGNRTIVPQASRYFGHLMESSRARALSEGERHEAILARTYIFPRPNGGREEGKKRSRSRNRPSFKKQRKKERKLAENWIERRDLSIGRK